MLRIAHATVQLVEVLGPELDTEDVEDLEEVPENEVEPEEEEIHEQATAERTIAELKIEIATLARLEDLVAEARRAASMTQPCRCFSPRMRQGRECTSNGRIRRFGQTEASHLWNLVAEEIRECDVYRTLLEELEEARKALGGQVFDVLGKLHCEGRSLRALLIHAIRYRDLPEVRDRRLGWIDKTRAAVKDRLAKEITY